MATSGAQSVKALATPVGQVDRPGAGAAHGDPGPARHPRPGVGGERGGLLVAVSMARMPSLMQAASVSSMGPPIR